MATLARPSDSVAEYAAAEPFPHAIVDGYFPLTRALAAAREMRLLTPAAHRNVYSQAGKWTFPDLAALPPETAGLIREMSGAGFIAWLERLTGISGLVADPSLFGGGVHQIARGGFLKIHADFAWHERLRLYRRVNVLLYLNEDWRDEWGGQLELWRPDMSACAVRIAPRLNRMVIFSTSDTSFHGHPEPLACPEGVTRNSIALYYYAPEPAPASIHRHSEWTNNRARPGERFLSLRYLRQQWLIRRRGSM